MGRNGRIDIRVTSSEASGRSWVVKAAPFKERPKDRVKIVVPKIVTSKGALRRRSS